MEMEMQIVVTGRWHQVVRAKRKELKRKHWKRTGGMARERKLIQKKKKR